MLVKQISIFIQDEKGRLADICDILGESGINICGFTVSDTAEGYGIFRILTNEPEKTANVLSKNGFTVSENDVIAVKVPNEPGGLSRVLSVYSENNLNVEYMYATAGTLIAFKLDNNEKAIKALNSAGIEIVGRSEFLSMQ